MRLWIAFHPLINSYQGQGRRDAKGYLLLEAERQEVLKAQEENFTEEHQRSNSANWPKDEKSPVHRTAQWCAVMHSDARSGLLSVFHQLLRNVGHRVGCSSKQCHTSHLQRGHIFECPLYTNYQQSLRISDVSLREDLGIGWPAIQRGFTRLISPSLFFFTWPSLQKWTLINQLID